ncbi:asialoglycoprotein receptor 2 isoform X2 [Ictalurus furcatus]|uniref:asialoglycoprotein receptor 2 isoform X2 n=1 Tax=Ictalurus furcatus TaxID=66913 RepID=UPI00234FFBCE|nr:asialoglycoprotein receptor 2 isoform X2 [Ictalurus furcatus]
MQAISGNIGFDLCKMESSENYHSPLETEDDVYLTTQNCCPKSRKYTDIFIQKKVKFCISALGLLLLLGALMALCAVGILYHNKVVSFEILHEQYENATVTLMMQENKAKEKEGMYEALEAKFLELNLSCSKKEGMYEVLEVKYQELDFACNINQSRRCEEGWKSLGLKCYYFSTEKLNWIRSRDYCVGKGSHLVIITSQTEQNFVSSQIGETHWIGLNDLETEGKWMWVNNQPLKETGVKGTE